MAEFPKGSEPNVTRPEIQGADHLRRLNRATQASISGPSARYYKDPYGLKPTWRLFFIAPKHYIWLKLPNWLVLLVCRYRDRRGGLGRMKVGPRG